MQVVVHLLRPQFTTASLQLMEPHVSEHGPSGEQLSVKPTPPPWQSTLQPYGPLQLTTRSLHPLGPLHVSFMSWPIVSRASEVPASAQTSPGLHTETQVVPASSQDAQPAPTVQWDTEF